jgi:NAD(P)-dependent dehydrogenase (short-subunit alcohol dehydrogenase family)
VRRILITGANRGIGLDLTRRHLAAGDRVFATCRDPWSARELNALAEQYPVLSVLTLDVTDSVSIAALRRVVGEAVDGLEILYNNAGIFPGGVDAQEPGVSAFGSLDARALIEVFAVNSVAPVMVTQAFADLLRRGVNPRVVNLSSRIGSVTLSEPGYGYGYPASKAALNRMTRTLAQDLQADGVIVISIHPGWVATDMGGVTAPRTMDETLPSMMQLIDGLTLADSGAFFNWDGKKFPW